MMDLSTLTNAAKLQGYLVATDAPRAIILLAEQIIEAATQAFAAGERAAQHVRNEDVRLPEPSKLLADAIVVAAATAPSHDQSRFIPSDATQADEETDRCEVDGAALEVALVAGGKPSDAGMVRRSGQRSKLDASMLPAVEAALTSETFGVVGHQFGVSGETLKNFLRKHGVDPAKYRKTVAIRYQRAAQFKNGDEWPEATKPAPKTEEQPRMKFKTVTTTEKRRGRWGEYNYPTTEVVAQPEGTYTDPETGAKVTKYPAGYAIGTGPQRNISVKGGA
jgi:hypothetical protein